MDARRWLIAGIVVALLVGFIAFARGPVNHHGQQVGVRVIGPGSLWSSSTAG
jgi:hypothetical protein